MACVAVYKVTLSYNVSTCSLKMCLLSLPFTNKINYSADHEN